MSKSNLTGCFANPNMDNGLGDVGSCVQQKLVNGKVPVGGCTSSDGSPGYKNTTGFPNCCVESPSEKCKNIVSGTASVVNKVSNVVTDVVTDVVKAAKNCVAKNPNYPSEIGGCVYNPNNPCPSKYEITDSRFGTKMCCAPKGPDNLDCYSSKSTFGSSSNSDNLYMILFILFLMGVVWYLKNKKGSSNLFGRRR